MIYFTKNSTNSSIGIAKRSHGEAVQTIDLSKNHLKSANNSSRSDDIRSSATLTLENAGTLGNCTQSCPALDFLDEINVKTLQHLVDEQPLPQWVGKRKCGKGGKNKNSSSDHNVSDLANEEHKNLSAALNSSKRMKADCEKRTGTVLVRHDADVIDALPARDGIGTVQLQTVFENNSLIRCNDCKKGQQCTD